MHFLSKHTDELGLLYYSLDNTSYMYRKQHILFRTNEDYILGIMSIQL